MFQHLLAQDKLLPRQEFTSCMQLAPGLVLGSKPCKAPGRVAEGVQRDKAALEHGTLLSPPGWLSQHHHPVL